MTFCDHLRADQYSRSAFVDTLVDIFPAVFTSCGITIYLNNGVQLFTGLRIGKNSMQVFAEPSGSHAFRIQILTTTIRTHSRNIGLPVAMVTF